MKIDKIKVEESCIYYIKPNCKYGVPILRVENIPNNHAIQYKIALLFEMDKIESDARVITPPKDGSIVLYFDNLEKDVVIYKNTTSVPELYTTMLYKFNSKEEFIQQINNIATSEEQNGDHQFQIQTELFYKFLDLAKDQIHSSGSSYILQIPNQEETSLYDYSAELLKLNHYRLMDEHNERMHILKKIANKMCIVNFKDFIREVAKLYKIDESHIEVTANIFGGTTYHKNDNLSKEDIIKRFWGKRILFSIKIKDDTSYYSTYFNRKSYSEKDLAECISVREINTVDDYMSAGITFDNLDKLNIAATGDSFTCPGTSTGYFDRIILNIILENEKKTNYEAPTYEIVEKLPE